MNAPSARLGDIVTLNPPTPRGLLGSPEEVAIVPMAAVAETGTIVVQEHRPANEVSSGLSYFADGDVLVAKITPCYENNKIALATVDRQHAFGSTEFHVLRPEARHLDARYLVHFLRQDGVREQGKRRMTGSGGQRRVPRSFLEELAIPLPPLDEQRRIAAILDQADALRHKRRQALSQASALKVAIFESMFGGDKDLRPNVQVKALGNVVRAGTIVTYGMVQAGEEFEGGVPYIRTGDIIDGEIAVHQLRKADPAIAARFDRARVDAGDIIMSIRATVGTTARVPKELAGANLTQGTAKIAPGELTDPSYLLEYLRSKRAQDWIAKQVKGATFREITLGRLREMPVELPRMDLQKKFAARIAKLAASQCAQREQARQFDTLFASLRHRAFAGEL